MCAFAKCRVAANEKKCIRSCLFPSVRQVVGNKRMSKDIWDKCFTNVYVCANICSIRIRHCAIFGSSGNNFDQKSGPNLRMVACTSLPMTPLCFSSNFTHQYAAFAKILKTLKIEKKTLISFDAKFRTFFIFAVEMAAKTVFKLPEFEFIVKIEVTRFYAVLQDIFGEISNL